jgi:hypothetical protein
MLLAGYARVRRELSYRFCNLECLLLRKSREGTPMPACPMGSTCIDIGGGAHYCLLNYNGGCMRSDLSCRDCGASVCGPRNFCGGC